MVSERPSVFLFAGSDGYSKEKAIHSLSSSILDGSSRELDMMVLRGGHTSAREILDSVSTIPFLAPQRLVIVREFDELSDEDRARVIGYAKKPLKSACLVLEMKGDAALREFGQASRYATVKVYGAVTGQDLASWIRTFAADRGKKITPDAIAALKETCSPDLALLSQELEKLISFIGAGDTITAVDVEELVGRSLVASVFDLTNAIEENKVDKALAVVAELLVSGKKHYEIIGLMAWHVKRLLRAKTLQMKGGTETYIANSLKINQKYFGRFFKQVKALKIDAIRSKMRVLLEADLDIKRSRLDPRLALECAVIRLCLGGG